MSMELIPSKVKDKTIIKKCHICGEIIESFHEVERCPSCKKPFLPCQYFGKVHAKNTSEFKQLFSHVSELQEDLLIKGLYTIW